ncbi:MAG: hypothetical protein ACK5FT_07840 [Sphingomonadales bacterium]|jgi:hypothetical protein
MNRILAILCLAVLTVSACKKYKDGPYVSVWSRKERIEGKWVVAYAEKNQQEITNSYKSLVMEFTRNYSVIETTDTSKINGIWGTMTNDNDFVIDYDNGNRSIYEIKRLTRKQFWIRNKQSELILHLKPF